MKATALHRSLVASYGVSDVSAALRKSKSLQIGVKSIFFNGLSKRCTSLSTLKLGKKRMASVRKRCMVVRSTMSSDPEPSSGSIAPLQLESPVGQFLSQILLSHPHLVSAAVEEQLEQLQSDRDGVTKEDSSAPGTELVLYRRIAEVKANERKTALQEILYALVVKKFMDSSVPLVSNIDPDSAGRVNSWPSQDEKLEKLHSPEAYEMIQNHLSLILGNRIGDTTSFAQISKIRVGQVYAASVMYGYFLKRIDQRFQLEKAVKVLESPRSENEPKDNVQSIREEIRPSGGDESIRAVHSHPEVSWDGGMGPAGFSAGMKASRLRTYVMSFDGETLQRYATIRSKEAVGIIEKHTEALFGRPEIVLTPQGTIDSSQDELIKISFSGLKRLVLEAVTFGSFLWDVESYVDSRYHFVTN